MHRMRTPRLIVLAVASTFALTATYAAAQSAPDGAPAKPPTHKRFQEKLGLTDDQMSAIRAVHARHADQQKQLWQSLHQAQTELRQLALNGGDVKDKTAEVTALLGQMTELRAATLQEIAPLLKPEQRDAMAKMSPYGRWHRGPRPTQGS